MTPTSIKKISLDRPQPWQRNQNTSLDLSKKNKYGLEVDRLFFCVNSGEKTVSILQELGLHSPKTIVKSESQGTLSKIFFFNNIYLAIVWLDRDGNSYRNELQTGIDFPARTRWKETKASPFGIGLSKRQKKDIPFYLEQDLVRNLVVDKNIYYSKQNQKNLLEPFVFFLPDRFSFKKILNVDSTITREFLAHPLGVQTVTDIKIIAQKGKRRDSEIINFINKHNILTIDRANEPLLELTFDRGIKGKTLDVRPMLPIIIKY